MWLRQSTAGQVISLGQFLNTTDGNSNENGLTLLNTDIKLRKGGTTTLANKNSGGATNISDGVYHATLDATDSSNLGLLEVYINVAGALPVKQSFIVLPAATYDALVTNGLNDLAQSDIVTGGAIGTAGGVVSNVATVATTTLNSDMLTPAQVWANATRTLTSNAGFNDISAADVWSYVTRTLTSGANLNDISASDVWSFATRELTSGNNIILAKNVGLTGLNDLSFNDMWVNNPLPESYAADGVQPTPAQSMYLTMQSINDFAIAGTSYSVKGLDGLTTVATYTLDSATDPITSKTRTA